MLIVKRDSWHYTVYWWWWVRYSRGGPLDRVNLCPYLRAVLIWAPLRFLFTAAPYLRAFAWGGVLYLIPWLINFLPEPGGTEALIFFQEIYLVFGVMGSFWPAAVLFPKSFLGRRISNRVGLPADRFLNLLIAGIVAAHDKVCPILNVEDRDE